MGIFFRKSINFTYSFHSLLSPRELTLFSVQHQIQVDSIKLKDIHWNVELLIWGNF